MRDRVELSAIEICKMKEGQQQTPTFGIGTEATRRSKRRTLMSPNASRDARKSARRC